ncbi:MAG: MFS transporter [Firmicutes bacterium]|nr:MFS transporter [Bacillota bacterium]
MATVKKINVKNFNVKKLYTAEFLAANIINFLVLTGNSLINNLYPVYLKSIGKSETNIGYIMGFLAVSAFAGRLLMGPRIDSRGRRFFIILGSSMLSAACILYAVPIHSDSWYIFVRILHGLGFGAYFTAIFTWIADYAPEGRMAEAIGIFGISGLLTSASGVHLGESILRMSENNFLYLFLTGSVLVLAGCILSVKIQNVQKPGGEKSKDGLMKLLANPAVYPAVLIAFIFGFGNGTIYIFMANFVKASGLPAAAPFFTAYSVGAIFIRVVSSKVADRMGRMAMIVPAFLIMALGQSYLFMVHNETGLLIIGFLLGMSHGMVYPAINALMLDRAGIENRGAGTGIFNASVDVGTFICGPLFGYLADTGGYGYMYSACAVLVAAGLAVFFLWANTREKENPESEIKGILRTAE